VDTYNAKQRFSNTENKILCRDQLGGEHPTSGNGNAGLADLEGHRCLDSGKSVEMLHSLRHNASWKCKIVRTGRLGKFGGVLLDVGRRFYFEEGRPSYIF
jgi:hypothetical protein